MKFISLSKLVFALAAFIATLSSARATTIDPLTLEQLVSGASFVGVVECETAGGIVAGYRVVESWKGTPVGTQFYLKTPVNYWEPQFPIALVGERSVVTAYADQPPSRVMSTTSGGGVPLWWRDIPYEYSLPLFQGQASVPKTVNKSYYAFDEEYSTYAEFQAKVQKFLKLSPEQTEVALMRSLFQKYSGWREKPKTEIAEIMALKKRIETSTTAAQMANALLTLGWKDREAAIAPALSQGGGAATLKFLSKLKESQWPFDKSERERIMSAIQSRVLMQRLRRSTGVTTPATKRQSDLDKNEPIEPAPSATELARMRDVLQGKIKPEVALPGDNLGRAIETLTKHDPAVVAEYLANWKNDMQSWSDADRGYVLGSYFAWQCAGEREVHLRTLPKAQDPFIRVAGAVYLCFENREEGMTELQKLIALPGDPGAWAALNLARREDKTAIPRALKVLETNGKGNMEGVPHRNLQKRLLVLLSNSAKKSGVAQPLDGFSYASGEDEESSAKIQYQHVAKWWETNQEKIKLDDPWLPLLEKQKVD